MALQIIVDTRDVTARVEQLSWSSTDPGGCEVASFTLPSDEPVYRGTRVTILDGLSVAWFGRIAEVTVDVQNGVAVTQVSAEGYAAALRDNPYVMPYIDRDLSQWQGPSLQRQINIRAVSFVGDGSQEIAQDTATNNQSLKLTAGQNQWDASHRPGIDGWYDAGTAKIARIIANPIKFFGLASGDANLSVVVAVADDDIDTNDTPSGNLNASTSVDFTPGTARRFAKAAWTYAIAGGSATAGDSFAMSFGQLLVIGNHGLPLRGAGITTYGFYPSDIARHALQQARGIVPGVIVDSTNYIAPHVTYKEPVPPGQVVDDMCKLAGWHWGVWEPVGAFGTSPRLDFRPPPADATAVVARADCSQNSITQRLGDLYDTAKVRWTDPAGVETITTVTVTNSLLNEAGLSPRTLELDAGVSTLANAQSLGNAALLLSQQSGRGSGSATLPTTVGLPGGGRMPAHLLRPGIDRLRILDLPNAGPVTDTDTRRRDTFRISRLETTVDQAGTPQTRVDLDDGSNLLETLQARLAIATLVSGN